MNVIDTRLLDLIMSRLAQWRMMALTEGSAKRRKKGWNLMDWLWLMSGIYAVRDGRIKAMRPAAQVHIMATGKLEPSFSSNCNKD